MKSLKNINKKVNFDVNLLEPTFKISSNANRKES